MVATACGRDAANLECLPGLRPGPKPGQNHGRWSALTLAGLAGVIACARDGRIPLLDRAVIRLAENGRKPAAIRAARTITALGEPGFAAFPVGAVTVHLARQAGWRRACVPPLTVVSGAVVRRLLSRAIARPRPPAGIWLTEPEGFSMPSKHTTLAALTAGVCVASSGVGGLGRHGIPLLAAAGVGASRIYLGVHWPSDVVVAWMFAEAWLQLAEALSTAAAAPPTGARARTRPRIRKELHEHA